MTDPQTFFNVAISIAGGFGGWVLKMIYDRVRDLQAADTDLAESLDEVKANYARRDDFKDAIGEIKTTLLRIETKLDKKVDK